MKMRNAVWPVREIGTYPNTYVDFHGDGRMVIESWGHRQEFCGRVVVDRRSARLLVKRINQALDAWRKHR